MTAPVVLKIGGELIADPARRAWVASELAALVRLGGSAVVVHGGGPQATALTTRLGLEPNVVGGRRITSPEVLEVMKMTLAGQVSVDLAAACRAAGVRALGLAGVSAGLVRAKKRPPRVVSGCGDAPIDFGEVGDVTGVDAEALMALVGAGFVPLVSSLGADDAGRVLNINADIVANDVALAVRAPALVMLTGVNGVLRDLNDPLSRYPVLTVAEAKGLIADGTVKGGMIPKLEESFRLLDKGVGRVCILEAGRPGALSAVLSGSTEQGTVLVTSLR